MTSDQISQRVRRLVQAGAPAWVIGWYLSEAGLREQSVSPQRRECGCSRCGETSDE